MEKDRCKNLVSHGFLRCKRKASIDGFCKQHHPGFWQQYSYKKRAEKRYEEKMKNSPWYKLGKALERIKELEAEIAELKNKLRSLNRRT